MAGRLQSLITQASKTFNSGPVDDKNLNKLVATVNKITIFDCHLPPKLLNSNSGSIGAVEHLSIHENDKLSIGVFMMKPGSKLPLHDHPGMYGILKVVRGVLSISSYNVEQLPEGQTTVRRGEMFYSDPVCVSKNPPIIISETDDCSILAPRKSNIHEVLCVAGPAAFLDILAPPYDYEQHSHVPRACHYFKENRVRDDGLVELVQIPCPPFWRDDPDDDDDDDF